MSLEDGIAACVAEDLMERGHDVQWPVTGHDRAQFGRGQVIASGSWWESLSSCDSSKQERVLWAGSDARGDGCALGY